MIIGCSSMPTTAAAAAGMLFCQLVLLLSASSSTVAVSSNTVLKDSTLTTEMLLSTVPPAAPGRFGSLRTLQQFFTLKPQCFWEDGACTPSLTNWAMHPGQPSSPYRTAILITASRAEQCAKRKDATACHADGVNRCYWFTNKNNRTQQECRSSDYLELMYWADKHFAADISALPMLMMCPGSKAAEFYACFGRVGSTESCKYMRSCYSTTLESSKVCFPKWLANYTQVQRTAYWKSLAELDSKLYGSCAGACWVKQAKACLRLSSEAACSTKPTCRWLAGSSKCVRTTLEFSSGYDQLVARLYGMCYATETQQECEAHVAPSMGRQATAQWLKLNMSSSSVKCKL